MVLILKLELLLLGKGREGTHSQAQAQLQVQEQVQAQTGMQAGAGSTSAAGVQVCLPALHLASINGIPSARDRAALPCRHTQSHQSHSSSIDSWCPPSIHPSVHHTVYSSDRSDVLRWSPLSSCDMAHSATASPSASQTESTLTGPKQKSTFGQPLEPVPQRATTSRFRVIERSSETATDGARGLCRGKRWALTEPGPRRSSRALQNPEQRGSTMARAQ